MNRSNIIILDLEYKPFTSVYQAIAYYNHNKPGRLKALNLLEPEGGQGPLDPEDIFASVLLAIQETCRHFDNLQMTAAFSLYHLSQPRQGKEDISKILGVPRKRVTKWLNQMTLYLESECIDRGLIASDDDF